MEKLAEYTFTDHFETTDQMVQDFKDKGYILVRNLFDKDEVEKFIKAITDSDAFYKNAYVLEAGERKIPRITWSHPGSDVTGLAARSEKVVNTCEKKEGYQELPEKRISSIFRRKDIEYYQKEGYRVLSEGRISSIIRRKNIEYYQKEGYRVLPERRIVHVIITRKGGYRYCFTKKNINILPERRIYRVLPGEKGYLKTSYQKDGIWNIRKKVIKYYQKEGYQVLTKGRISSIIRKKDIKYYQKEGYQVLSEGRLSSITRKKDIEYYQKEGYQITRKKDIEYYQKEGYQVLPEGRISSITRKKVIKYYQKEGYQVLSKGRIASIIRKYWYNCGNLYPDMMTVWVALDKCTKENSCLEILSGSNNCGRIEHHPHDGQIVAQKSRVDVIREKCPHIYAEMNPGDALFFHCNTLHHSSANRSDLRRWAYIMCYNKATNNPTFAHHHAQYTPIEKVPNSAIKECTNLTDLSGKEFIHPSQNATIAGLFAKYSANS
ncbi:unnamed protein product [Mytilus coruscus]|uniref:Phytanoyl-CoA dioxygenase n=1 Tax=Mytilus coruscus TaxID=42192 RepID=A0A6J8CVN8_MYTCO|nr:unnamed protein product [Mytilus coruscus]